MAREWANERELTDKLRAIHKTSPPVSRSAVEEVSKLAVDNRKFFKHVVKHVEKFAERCKSEHTLTALYIIDGICRRMLKHNQAHATGKDNVYAKRFAANMPTTIPFLTRNKRYQTAMERVALLWHQLKLFEPPILSQFFSALGLPLPSAPAVRGSSPPSPPPALPPTNPPPSASAPTSFPHLQPLGHLRPHPPPPSHPPTQPQPQHQQPHTYPQAMPAVDSAHLELVRELRELPVEEQSRRLQRLPPPMQTSLLRALSAPAPAPLVSHNHPHNPPAVAPSAWGGRSQPPSLPPQSILEARYPFVVRSQPGTTHLVALSRSVCVRLREREAEAHVRAVFSDFGDVEAVEFESLQQCGGYLLVVRFAQRRAAETAVTFNAPLVIGASQCQVLWHCPVAALRPGFDTVTGEAHIPPGFDFTPHVLGPAKSSNANVNANANKANDEANANANKANDEAPSALYSPSNPPPPSPKHEPPHGRAADSDEPAPKRQRRSRWSPLHSNADVGVGGAVPGDSDSDYYPHVYTGLYITNIVLNTVVVVSIVASSAYRKHALWVLVIEAFLNLNLAGEVGIRLCGQGKAFWNVLNNTVDFAVAVACGFTFVCYLVGASRGSGLGPAALRFVRDACQFLRLMLFIKNRGNAVAFGRHAFGLEPQRGHFVHVPDSSAQQHQPDEPLGLDDVE